MVLQVPKIYLNLCCSAQRQILSKVCKVIIYKSVSSIKEILHGYLCSSKVSSQYTVLHVPPIELRFEKMCLSVRE